MAQTQSKPQNMPAKTNDGNKSGGGRTNLQPAPGKTPPPAPKKTK